MCASIGCGESSQQYVDHCDHENSHHQQIIGSFIAPVFESLQTSLCGCHISTFCY